jgi:hypothetical protein
MNTKETLQIIESQIENLKKHRNIDVPTTLIQIDEIDEDNFDDFKLKVKSKDLSVIVNNQGDMYNVFNFVAPKPQRTIKDILQYTPYIAAIITAIFGLINSHYILAASLLIPFISGFLTGFIKPNILTIIILGGLIFYFIQQNNLVGFLFMCNWAISILLTGLIRNYIKKILAKLSMTDEKIFSFLYYSRLIQVYNLKSQQLAYSK